MSTPDVNEVAQDVSEVAGDAVEAVQQGAEAVANAINGAINSDEAQVVGQVATDAANQAGAAVAEGATQGANAATDAANQAGAAIVEEASQAGAAIADGATQGANAANAAMNSGEAQAARQAATEAANQAGAAIVEGASQAGNAINAAANSDEAKMAAAGAAAAGGAIIAGMKNINVPSLSFDTATAKQSLGAASASLSACVVDVMQLEITRDFFQFLGIMGDSIKFPSGFRSVFGSIAALSAASFSLLMARVEALQPSHWFFLFFVAGMGCWLTLVRYIRMDLNQDTRLKDTQEARDKMNWKKRNAKSKRTFYVVKALILACTTLFTPVTRNAIQMVFAAEKYSGTTYVCNNTEKTQFITNPMVMKLTSVISLAVNSSAMAKESVDFCDDKHKTYVYKNEYVDYYCTAGHSAKVFKCTTLNTSGQWIIFSIVSAIALSLFTVAMPTYMAKVIYNLKPKFISASDPEHPYADPPDESASVGEKEKYKQLHGKIVWFNDEGECEEFTDELYAVAVKNAGANPYISMYSGYEQKWSNFKLIVMVFKVLQMLPTIALTSHMLVGTIATPKSDAEVATQQLYQSLAAFVVMVAFSALSFYAAPFIRATHDRQDRISRVVLVITPLLLILSSISPGQESLIDVILNVVNFINVGFTVLFVLGNVPKVKAIIKGISGSLEFSDPRGGPVPYSGEGIPMYDLNLERRRRMWKPFWDNMFKTDKDLRATKIKEGGKSGKDKPYLKTGNGTIVKYPETRLEEMIDKLHHRGRVAFETSLLPISNAEADVRNKILLELEGPDCYCDDKWNAGGGRSITKDASLDSKTFFGRLEVDPYPYSLQFNWDGACKDYGEIFSWDSHKKGRVQEIYNMNMRPEIKDKKAVRLAVRGMAASGELFYLVQHWQTTETVEDGKDADGKTKYKTITINWTAKNGTVNLATDFGDSPFEQGFMPSMLYKDCVGIGSDGSHHKNNHKVFSSDGYGANPAMGITHQFERTPRFNELCNNRNNRAQYEAGIPKWQKQLQEHKIKVMNERVMMQYSLSWGFWYWVYNNDVITRGDLNNYFQSAEQNPVVKSIPIRHEQGLNCLFEMIQYFNASPIFATWYVFWADIWAHNSELSKIKKNAEFFDHHSPSAVCFKPVSKDVLNFRLKKLGNPLGKKQSEYVDMLYERMQNLSDGTSDAFKLQITTFARPVVKKGAVTIIKGYPTNEALCGEAALLNPAQSATA